jgi:hypothetical protein
VNAFDYGLAAGVIALVFAGLFAIGRRFWKDIVKPAADRHVELIDTSIETQRENARSMRRLSRAYQKLAERGAAAVLFVAVMLTAGPTAAADAWVPAQPQDCPPGFG